MKSGTGDTEVRRKNVPDGAAADEAVTIVPDEKSPVSPAPLPAPHSPLPTPSPLIGRTTAEIEELLTSLGQPRYRGRQVADWIYRRNAAVFAEMTDLPAALRQELAEKAAIGLPEIVTQTVSADSTTKYLLRLHDGETVECVWLPYREWSSVCVSSQVGCAMACGFCATGQAGFKRNLTAGEIVAQFLIARRNAARPLTHVVFMGMGEPLLNYDAVLAAIRILNTECGIGARNMTVSTVGIVPGIRKLAQEPLQINLALSLHGPDDATRAQFMPVAKHYPLDAILQALHEYITATHRKVTLEYLLIAGVNDSRDHADRLARLIQGRRYGIRPEHVGVNLIPYNETGTGFQRPTEEAIRAFLARLQDHGVSVTRRLERGHEIAAACGQLRRTAGTPGYRMKPKG